MKDLKKLSYIEMKNMFKKNTAKIHNLQKEVAKPLESVEDFTNHTQRQVDLTNLIQEQKDLAAEITAQDQKREAEKAKLIAKREKEAEEAQAKMLADLPGFAETVKIAFDGIAAELESMIDLSRKLKATGKPFDDRLSEHQLRLAVKNQFTKSFGVHQSNLYGPNEIGRAHV